MANPGNSADGCAVVTASAFNLPDLTCGATVGAVDEKTIQEYIENQKWGDDDRGFKITTPAEP